MRSSRKIVSQDQLLELRNRAREDEKTVVHCHGCFDIVHPGHIAHLQFARSQGDYLVVSVSADTHVNKGVNRPLIPDDLRASSLAALECVDWVYVNEHPTAIELLEALKPDIYIKGREYETNHDPRFLAERETVVRHGGRVVFSSGDVVYSSTALIANLEESDALQREKLNQFRDRYDLSDAHLHHLVQRFRGKRVLVIGDYILDRYHFCDAAGVAGEAPVMSLRSLERRDFDGGAAVVALHLAGLGAAPVVVTSLADDDTSRQTELRLQAADVETIALRQRRQIVTKHRYLVDTSKMMKVDEGAISPLDSKNEETLAARIVASAKGAAAVIFCDFGYGLITAGLLERVMDPLRRTVPVLTADVSGKQGNLLRFKAVDLLCPTEREVRETMHDFASGLTAAVWNLLHATSSRQAIITLGKQGLIAFDHPDDLITAQPGRLRSEYLPALSGHAIDPLGCGDALLATASLTLAAGGSLQAAALLGSIAAAIEVRQMGNRPIDAEKLLAQLHRTDPAAVRLAS